MGIIGFGRIGQETAKIALGVGMNVIAHDPLIEKAALKIALGNDLIEAQVQNIFAEATDGLAETQIEKLRALSEGLDYDNVEDFEKKLNTLKESYFDNKAAISSDVEDSDPVELDEETQPKLTGSIANYSDAISRTVRK